MNRQNTRTLKYVESRKPKILPSRPHTIPSINFSGMKPPLKMESIAVSGMLWSLAGITLSRGISFVAQLVLGWVLSKEDFALYAIAISWSSVALALRNGGTQRLLVQKGAQYVELASVYLKIAVAFNLMCLVILTVMAAVVSELYGNAALLSMVWAIGLALLLGSAASIFQAKLSSNLDFARLARLGVWSSCIRYGAMIVFALLGFGPLSFVLPMVLVAIFETSIGWRWAGGWPPAVALTMPMLLQVFGDTRWVMLTALASALTVNGDYMAVSLLQSRDVLGVYFFGSQLSLALVVLFSSTLDSVMLPTFSALNHDDDRQRSAFLKGIGLLSTGATFACFGLSISAHWMIHVLWNGKWDDAILVVQLLSLSLPIRLIVPLCRSILEARGKWKLVSLLFLVDAVGTVGAGAIGAWQGNLFSIAAVVAGYNVLFGFFYCAVAGVTVGTRLSEICTPTIHAYGIGCAALLLASTLQVIQQPGRYEFAHIVTALTVYVLCYLGLTRLFLRHRYQDVINVAAKRLSVFRYMVTSA